MELKEGHSISKHRQYLVFKSTNTPGLYNCFITILIYFSPTSKRFQTH
uniref:Uncharacterized protein n=1 Tax=Anguilla anguilla TaxID=7936 RepID=A0A0E9RE75_ANGAN